MKKSKIKVSDILTSKLQLILTVENPLSIEFYVNEIEMLLDLNNLRSFKLSYEIPQDFKVSVDLFDCYAKVLREQSLFRVLEFCVLKNKVLFKNVTKVFPQLVR